MPTAAGASTGIATSAKSPLMSTTCLTNSRVGKKRCPGVLIREEILLDSLADMLQNALETALGSYALSLVELPQQTAERTDLKEKIASRKQEI